MLALLSFRHRFQQEYSKFKHDHTVKQSGEVQDDKCKFVKERKSDVSLLSKMNTKNHQGMVRQFDVMKGKFI